MYEWNVNVDGVGIIGTVNEETEDAARCAALSKYGEEGHRPLTSALPKPYIYENDEFSVSKR
ncbi:hypothetical protein JXVLWARM_CDS_0088 [Burkholderia phage Bm1]